MTRETWAYVKSLLLAPFLGGLFILFLPLAGFVIPLGALVSYLRGRLRGVGRLP